MNCKQWRRVKKCEKKKNHHKDTDNLTTQNCDTLFTEFRHLCYFQLFLFLPWKWNNETDSQNHLHDYSLKPATHQKTDTENDEKKTTKNPRSKQTLLKKKNHRWLLKFSRMTCLPRPHLVPCECLLSWFNLTQPLCLQPHITPTKLTILIFLFAPVGLFVFLSGHMYKRSQDLQKRCCLHTLQTQTTEGFRSKWQH